MHTSKATDMNKDIEQRISFLRQELHRHNYKYYVLSEPEIEDFQFDQLMKELEALEKAHPQYRDPNSPTVRVGSDLSQGFTTVSHKYPMLSLGNTYNEQELLEFDQRIKKLIEGKPTYVCELKFDGSSISLSYKDGQLTQAITRGNGVEGDEVTQNVRTIKTIPLQLTGDYPKDFEIRGEIVMPFQVFEELNRQKTDSGSTPFANPRNAASGSLKMLDSNEVAQRKLDAYLYLLLGDELPHDSHYENLQAAKTWGFKISEHCQRCEDINAVIEYIRTWQEKKNTLPVPIDGIVIKVDSRQQQQQLGNTAKAPRWAISYKYQAERAETQLLKVSYQVGRTGAITPIAHFAPVALAGTTVKKASLHNAGIIQQLDLYEHDVVYVEKGGEIIPKVVGVNPEKRLPEAKAVHFLTHCPACESPLVKQEGEAAFYCPNAMGCPPQITAKTEHFISRKAMDIEGLGSETIELLYRKKLIANTADLYTLKRENLAQLEGFGERSADIIIDGITASKEVPFQRVLFALGIRYVGETVAKKLVSAFHSIEQLRAASFQQLIETEEIGERIASSIQEYFASSQNQELLAQLQAHGLQFEISPEQLANKSTVLQGKTFVISGTFSSCSRDELKKLIEDNGGKNTSSISKKTDFLISGANTGPSKLEKAQKQGVNIIDESSFFEMIEN